MLVSCTGLTPGAAWLGLFYPANASTAPRAPLPYPHTAPWTENAPAEYVDLTAAADGSASYAFRLVNSLTDAQVHAFAGSSQGTPARVASSGPITFTDADAPMRVHLGRLQDPSTLRVIWNSRHNDDNPAVRWGFTQGGPYSNVAYAESFSYAREDLCPNVDGSESVATGHGWFWSGYYNYATISRLVPGDKRVIYYVAGSDVNGFSREFSTLPPPAPAADTPTNIVLVADMGVTTLDGTTDHWAEPDAGETIDHMRDHVQSGTGYDWNMVLHSGDLSYATGYQLKWPLFESKLHEGLSDRVPYMVNLGNRACSSASRRARERHASATGSRGASGGVSSARGSRSRRPPPDPPAHSLLSFLLFAPADERDYPGTTGHYPTSLDSGGECGIATQIRFPSPAPGSAAFKDEEYYSLVVGNTYVVMIGTEIEVGPGSDQYLWIESTLASVVRRASGRRPPRGSRRRPLTAPARPPARPLAEPLRHAVGHLCGPPAHVCVVPRRGRRSRADGLCPLPLTSLFPPLSAPPC